MNPEDEKLFLSTPLIKCLAKDAQEKALKTFEIVNIKKNQYLFHEDDHIKNTYILLQGTLKISTSHQLSKNNVDFETITAGEIVGEQSLFSDQDRSATILATSDCKLAMISRNDFESLISQTAMTPFFPMLIAIKKIRDKRITSTSKRLTTGLKKEIELLKRQKNIITFFISMIVGLCIFSFLIDTISYLNVKKNIPEITSTTLVILLGLWAFWNAKKTGLSLEDQGLTIAKWKITTFDAIMYTIPILVLMSFGKYLLITFSSYHQKLPLFDLNNIDIYFSLSYALISVPIQEYITRSVLQGSLHTFLNSRSPWPSIIISNIIFGTFHLGLGEEAAAVVLISGFFFGWLYHRQRNLIGVWIAHTMIGLWGLDIIHLQSLF